MRSALLGLGVILGLAVTWGSAGCVSEPAAPGDEDAAGVVEGSGDIGDAGNTADAGIVTTGFASDLTPGAAAGCTSGLVEAAQGGNNFNPAFIGSVTAADGQRVVVPAPVHDGPAAVDVFNNCTGPGDNPDYLSQLETVVINEDGVEITGFIFGDNYFELYVNGQFVGRDPVGMTPFNSNVVRFRAAYPMTYAVMGVDWETHNGVGMEYDSFNLGDGGFIAYFSDGNGTHGDWRAETFYIAPLDDPSCVRTAGGRDSSFCSQAVRPACAQDDPSSCKALHFPVPSNWTAPEFDDAHWPHAIVWPAARVTGQRAYTGYTQLFGDAEFVWTRNIRLDNLVLGRYTATGPRR